MLDDLIHRVDLDGLVRLIDDSTRQRDWATLDRVRRRSLAATHETGRQLWPAATLAEYRLALHAPAEWLAPVLDDAAGRFTIGPLSEVAAVNHTWAELQPHLEPNPAALFVAHERALRGETIPVADLAALPPVIDIPAAIQPWEPTYPKTVYHNEGADHADPPQTQLDSSHLITIHTANTAERLDDPDVDLAVYQLVEPWIERSTGRLEVATVAGSALDAIGALGPRTVRLVPISTEEALATLAWAGASGGAHGRRRGMANGRFSTWWLLGALGELHHDWPPTNAAIEDLLSDLEWFRWDAFEPPSGWRLQLALTDRTDGTSWVLNGRDDD